MMFDQPPSLPIRAAIASFLGGLFGIGLILVTHTAQAQTVEPVAETTSAAAVVTSAMAETGAVIRRLGDATLRTLRGPEPAIRGLRINDPNPTDTGSGLRWQMVPKRVLRSEVENPRGNDQISLGVQVRF